MVSESTKNIVKSLREARDERGLTITDLVAQTGISESTIRRVFLDNIDNISGFNYEGTLAPLIDFLLKNGDIKDSALSQTRIDGLLALIESKEETIARFTRQIAEMKADQASRCKKCEDNVSFLKKQIDLKDERMDKKDEWIDRLLGHIEEMLHK